MKLTPEEGRDIVWGDSEDWETIESYIEGTRRWSEDWVGVFLYKPSKKMYQLKWSVGSTESQDESAFDYSDPEPVEVWAVKKEAIRYTTVEPKKPILKKEIIKTSSLKVTLLQSEDTYDGEIKHRLIVKDENDKTIDEVGIQSLSECPEDAIIGRDLIDGDDLISFIKLGYKAGKEGFELNIEHKNVGDIWEE